MASNAVEDMDISKLKVPDLKKELKARGLSTSGNKTDLVERLQAAMKSNKLDDNGTTGSADDLDEDLLNNIMVEQKTQQLRCTVDDLDEHLDSSVIQELDSAIEATSPEKTQKRKVEESSNKTGPAKKIILNRNPSVSSETQNGSENEAASNEKSGEDSGKKVIKLSQLSVKERLEMRARKFGVELSATAKKAARSERFGLISDGKGSSSSSVDVLQKRAERFGVAVSPLLSKLDQQQRLEKRKERFGVVNGSSQSEKAKQRLERFKQPVK